MVKMTRGQLCGVSVAMAMLVLAAVPLRASDPIGVYALVDRVVLQPNDANPTAAQVWGVFSFAVSRSRDSGKPEGSFGNASVGEGYGPVQRGYLNYSCPKGGESACRNEWADLKAAASKHEIVGFGSRYSTTTSAVRKAGDRPASPDPYPINVGVVKIGAPGAIGSTSRTQYPDLVAALEAAARKK